MRQTVRTSIPRNAVGTKKLRMDGGKKSQLRESPVFGHSGLDSQHETEIQIVDRFERTLLEGGRLAVLSELFDQLCAYVVLHFSTEETLMVESDYPDLTRHQTDHHRMRLRMFRLERRFREGDPSAADETLQLMRRWASGHNSSADQKLAVYLAKFGNLKLSAVPQSTPTISAASVKSCRKSRQTGEIAKLAADRLR